MIKKVSFLLPIISISLLYSSSYAAHIKVINENQKKLKLKIIPEGGSNKFFIKELSSESTSQLTVSGEDIENKTYFSIEGDTNPFLGDTCKHLSVSKNYQVTFQNDTVGTTCIAEEK